MHGIEKQRKAIGLTQLELSEKIGVSQAAVALWEKGKAYPLTEKLPLLAKVLKCSIDSLFTNTLESESDGQC